MENGLTLDFLWINLSAIGLATCRWSAENSLLLIQLNYLRLEYLKKGLLSKQGIGNLNKEKNNQYKHLPFRKDVHQRYVSETYLSTINQTH